jgi:hypothetical protein
MKIKTKNNGYKLNSPSLSDKYAKYKEGKNLRKMSKKPKNIYICHHYNTYCKKK